MEKNYWVAIILSFVVLMAYPYILQKMYPRTQAPVSTETEAVTEPAPPKAIQSSVPDATTEPLVLAPSVVQFSNALYDVQFSTLGAAIVSLSYKGDVHKTHVAEIPFYSGTEEEPGLFAFRFLHDDVDLTKTVFKMTKKENDRFEFVYEKAGDYRITKEYSIGEDRPVIWLNLTLENLSQRERHFPIELLYGFYYGDAPHAHRVDVEAVVYGDKVRSEKMDKIRKKGFWTEGNFSWTGLLKKYFAILVRPEWKIISNENKANDNTIWSAVRMEPLSVAPSSQVTRQIFIYAGPQRYETLKNFEMDFELILSKGFFGLFKVWLLIALKFLNQFVHNFGWAIILLTIALKVAFIPLTHMSYESMRKMQAIQPKLKSIQERHKKDPTKMNREVMELYRRNKVNPMGGCLPMVAQIPIFIAFYQVLNETIELKGASFVLWIHDLSLPDKLFQFPFDIPFVGNAFNLLPLLMIGSMVWQQKLTPQMNSSPEQAKMMQFMPVMFGFFFYQMPSGLVLYWFVNNMLTIFHQLVIKRMGDVVLHHEDRE
jgi:YidC/Oxa1 family membrane protein insertase